MTTVTRGGKARGLPARSFERRRSRGTQSEDPRIRARRIEVRREAGRRRLNRVAVAGIVLGLAAIAIGVAASPLLDVGSIEVDGMYRTPVEEVIGAAGIEEGDPLVLADLDAAERRIESLPWVADARVSREWSGTVRYAIQERTPLVAVATADGGWIAADADGRVLAALEGPPPDLARLDGVEASAEPGDSLADAARPSLLVAEAVAAAAPGGMVVAGPERSVELRLASGGSVAFGPVEDPDVVHDQAVALTTVLQAVGAECIQRLDVRAPEAPVLTSSPACQ